MLNKQELVNFINEKLNEINSNYKFNIMAEVGETKSGVLSGILLTNKAETTNIPNYDEINYSFTVAILVPSARTNKKLLQVENIIGEFCNTYDATEQVFGETDVTLTITPGKPDNLRTEFEIGDCVPLYFTINGLWGNNVTSTKKHWFLDGVEIPFESEGVYLQKDGRTNKIQGIYNTQTLPTGVTKQYKFTFPYSTDFAGLQQDIFNGNFKKIYTLKYYDGESYTVESPFTAKVSLFATGDNNSARTRTAKFNVTFTDVDDGNTTVKYYLALIDNPFDNQTEDTRWFNSQAEQQTYFADKISSGCQYEQILAPNLNSLDITSQVYENTQGYDMLSLVNKNYAIIKITEPDTSTTPVSTKSRYLYYFVQSCQIGANNQYLYDLKLDTIQTYLFDPDIQFSDCFIEKANLNRWVLDEHDSSKVKFDGSLNSKLFTREDFQNLPKRLTNRRYLSLNSQAMTPSGNTNTIEEIEAWLDEHIQCWMYIYMANKNTYSMLVVNSNDPYIRVPGTRLPNIHYETVINETYSATDVNSAPSNMTCVCVPIYKKAYGTTSTGMMVGRTVTSNTNFNTYLSYKGINNKSDSFLDYNDNYEYISAIKISYVPPVFGRINCYIEGKHLILQGDVEELDTGDSNYRNMSIRTGNCSVLRSGRESGLYYGFLSVDFNKDHITLPGIDSETQYSFNRDDVIGGDKNVLFNPKLINTDFKELRISDSTENGFLYDLQKLNMATFPLIITQPFVPDITKTYIRIDTARSPVYGEFSKNNLTGFIGTNDTSLVMPTDAYSQMIANNKNFFLQNSTNREFDVINGIMGLVGGGFGTAVSGTTAKYGSELAMLKAGNATAAAGTAAAAGLAASAGVAGIAGMAALKLGSVAINNIRSKANEAFTVDNLKNAPASVQGAQGNVVFENMYSKFGLIIENWDALPNDKEIANDYMVRYGFNTNLIGNIFDYLNNSEKNSRKYFNFIKAQIQNISGIPMSNVARADIRDRFADGIRFWNTDNIDYTKENYEKWIEDPVEISRVGLSPVGTPVDGTLKTVEVVAVFDVNGNRVPGQYYTVSGVTEAVNVGTYTVTVTGRGLYTGTVDATWEIFGSEVTFSKSPLNAYLEVYDDTNGNHTLVTSPAYNSLNSGVYNFITASNQAISLSVTTDGTYSVSHTNNYNCTLTYSNATYVNVVANISTPI